MTNKNAINLSSLAVIGEELKQTLQKAQEAWLAFDVDMSNGTQLKAMLQALGQINGAFKMTEMHGASALVEDLMALGKLLLENENKRSSNAKATVFNALALLPKYLQLVLATGTAAPVLLIPIRNEVRSSAGLPRVAEQHYSNIAIDPQFTRADYDINVELDQPAVVATGKRLRQMYQTGLIGVLRETNPAPHLMLMQRACVRLHGQIKAGVAGDYWWLTAAVLEALSADQLELTYSRRRWLSTIDKAFRVFLQDPAVAYNSRASDTDLTEMLYLVSLVEQPGPLSAAVGALVMLQNADENEYELTQSRRFLYSAEQALDADSVARIAEEMAQAKEILELASSAHGCDITGLQSLKDRLNTIAEIMKDAGGNTIKERLQAQQVELSAWIDAGETVDHEALLATADLLLLVESILASDDKNALNSVQMDSMLSHSQLAAAELAVIKEAQAGINLAKRAITSYVESEFDPVHMGNVTVTLNSVRGGLTVLNLLRASSVANRCIQFIESSLKKDRSSDGSLLDTLADALISLEYYLSQVEVRKDTDEGVLDVADDSLAAIGFPA